VVRRSLHYDLLAFDGVLKLAQLDEGVSDVAHDLEAHVLGCFGDLVESHAVHLDGSGVFFLRKVDIAHVDSQAACLRLLLVLDDERVGVECL
jgi:hypothetical protein